MNVKNISFDELANLLERIRSKWNMPNPFCLFFADKKFYACSQTDNYQYFIIIKKNKIFLYSQEKDLTQDGIHIIPSWNTKGNYKTFENLSMEIDSFFNWMEEYDLQLQNTTMKRESL